MNSPQKHNGFMLVLVPEGGNPISVVARIRGLLKRAKRTFGLRCIKISPCDVTKPQDRRNP